MSTKQGHFERKWWNFTQVLFNLLTNSNLLAKLVSLASVAKQTSLCACVQVTSKRGQKLRIGTSLPEEISGGIWGVNYDLLSLSCRENWRVNKPVSMETNRHVLLWAEIFLFPFRYWQKNPSQNRNKALKVWLTNENIFSPTFEIFAFFWGTYHFASHPRLSGRLGAVPRVSIKAAVLLPWGARLCALPALLRSLLIGRLPWII